MAAGPGPASHSFSCESLRPLSPAILPPLTADAGEYTDTTQCGNMATRSSALLRSWGRPSPLHRTERKGSALPPGPYREGRAAAPRRALPRTVRSRWECGHYYGPHSKPGTLLTQ